MGVKIKPTPDRLACIDEYLDGDGRKVGVAYIPLFTVVCMILSVIPPFFTGREMHASGTVLLSLLGLAAGIATAALCNKHHTAHMRALREMAEQTCAELYGGGVRGLALELITGEPVAVGSVLDPRKLTTAAFSLRPDDISDVECGAVTVGEVVCRQCCVINAGRRSYLFLCLAADDADLLSRALSPTPDARA